MREVNVALIGYAFMGRAHSNAWRQVGRFLSPKLQPRLKVLCGRDRGNVKRAAAQLGWDEFATDWREVIARPDIDVVDVSTPGAPRRWTRAPAPPRSAHRRSRAGAAPRGRRAQSPCFGSSLPPLP